MRNIKITKKLPNWSWKMGNSKTPGKKLAKSKKVNKILTKAFATLIKLINISFIIQYLKVAKGPIYPETHQYQSKFSKFVLETRNN